MFVENTEPCLRIIGPFALIPGINHVDQAEWAKIQDSYGKPIQDLIDQGVISINRVSKPTIALIKKTYSISLLENWLKDFKNIKGPLRNAVFEQHKLMVKQPRDEKIEEEAEGENGES